MLRLIEQFIDPQVPHDGVRRGRRGRDRAHAGDAAVVADTLAKRMKAVALEREKIRQRERERLAQGSKVTLRQSPKRT